MRHKTVVLYSGGLDSTVVLAQELALGNEVLALTIDYAQSNRVEVDVCRRLAELWGFAHKVVTLPVERTDARAEIPARNTLFLAKALEQALIAGADTIAYGAEPDATYTDSSPAYIAAMDAVTRMHGVELKAPLRQLAGKRAVLAMALDLGVPLDLVHSSRTNLVNGADKASSRYLKTLSVLFPRLNPVHFLQLIAQSHRRSDANPYDLVAEQTGSFKFLPALFILNLPLKPGPLAVYTTGNWGASMQVAAKVVRSLVQIEVVETQMVVDLAKNELNTNHPFAQWGIKQALSRLPRPQFLNHGLKFRVTQGHLRQAVLALGYAEDQQSGLPLITE